MSEAGDKRKATMIARYGEEGFRKKMQAAGRKGGKATGVNTLTHEQLSAAGKLGHQAMLKKMMEESHVSKN